MLETLWTIQTETAYERFQKTGLLRADPEHLLFDGDFRDAYEWMAAQMRKRIGPAPEGVAYPVWAWYQWEGKRKRMDLRCSGYAKRGTPMVQITFEADRRDFLLSEFDSWHSVLGNWYIADNEQDWDAFLADKDRRSGEIVPSWDKIFDLNRYTPDWDTEPENQSVQATLWEIRMSQVKKWSISLQSEKTEVSSCSKPNAPELPPG